MELSRRNFLKGTGALAGISAMGAIGLGCSPAANEGTEAKGGKAEAPKTPAETTPTALKEATDGKFTAKAMGHENYIYVEATMAGGAIANLRVLTHDETVGVGSLATEMWPAKVVETQNLDVDAISGATTTCTAIKNAAIEAISNSGADVSQFQKGAQAPEKGEDQTIDTDVVIMGAGTAGLTAATRLLEKGFKVTLFEKQDIPGGSMSMTYSGLACAGSQLQKNYSLGRFDSSPFFDKDAMLGVLKGLVVPENDRFNGAMPYDDALYTTSPALVD